VAKFGKSSTGEEVTAGADLRGKLALVTGVSSGIGFETMRVLALRGATVIGTARTAEKARAACAPLGASAIPLACELESQDSIRACAAEVAKVGRPLDLLVANAGIMALPKLEQVNGIEKQFATNHLGHFLLTNLLLAQVEAAPASRVVVVSSAAHLQAPKGGIEFDNLSGARGYAGWRAYGQSKLANVLFAKSLARRLGPQRAAYSLHPGVIPTNLGRHMSPLITLAMGLFMRPFAKTIPQGAATTCYAAVHASPAPSGAYLSDCAVAKANPHADDAGLADRLWETSERLTGLA